MQRLLALRLRPVRPVRRATLPIVVALLASLTASPGCRWLARHHSAAADAAGQDGRVVDQGVVDQGVRDRRDPEANPPEPDVGDLAIPDVPRRDVVPAEPPPPPANTTCLSAQVLLPLDKSGLTINGDTGPSTDEFSSLRCKGTVGKTSPLTSPQLYYRFDATAGQWYRFELTPTFNAIFYAFSTGCTEPEIAKDCQSGGTTGVSSRIEVPNGKSQAIYFQAPKTGTVWVAVDGANGTSSAGDFVLMLSTLDVQINGTCGKPTAVSFTNGLATFFDSTLGLKNQHKDVNCKKTGTERNGPQAFYQLLAKLGYIYDITLQPQFKSYTYVFREGSCDAAAATGDTKSIDTDCGSSGDTGLDFGLVPAGVAKTFSLRPLDSKADTDYLIAVDSADSASQGQFKLTVRERKAPTNEVACKATVLGFGGGNSQTVSSQGARNEFPSPNAVTCNSGGASYAGPQLYYAFWAKAGKTYTITLDQPDFPAELFLFEGNVIDCSKVNEIMKAKKISADCQKPGRHVQVGANPPGKLTLTLDTTAPPATKYVIGIDTTVVAGGGSFTLTVEEKSP